MVDFITGHPIAQDLEPYCVVTAFNGSRIDFEPFGLTIPRANRIDPTRMDNETFLAILQTLDGRTFGPEGMPMDRWVFYDCCYMPGAIFGFARRATQLSDRARDVLDVPDGYTGLVPYSMYIAIPMLDERPQTWMGHNLASISPILPEENLRGLGTLTKGVALKAFRSEHFWGATQWTSKALHIHTKVGPLGLFTAYTPAHSNPCTLTYGFDVTDGALLASLRAPGHAVERPEPEIWVDSDDTDAMMALQDRIEGGERFVIPCAPERTETRVRVPVTSVPDKAEE